ncbi:uncharacterized protein [Drosophila tropicalis]|uniref:uncharacterized protein n=1 Tax=Drosophila tropicalis TaxID=46794 RepID=UPI0035AB85F7
MEHKHRRLILNIGHPTTNGSVAERSKALVLGTSPKGPLNIDPETNHLEFLNDLIEKIDRQRAVNTLIHLIRKQDQNCLFSSMRSSSMPILQLNEMANIDVKKYYNSEVLALLCINEYADTMLLTTLAKTLHLLPRGRIIIWINIRHPSDLSQVLFIIGNQATEHKFINLLAIHQTNDTLIGFLLKPFPVAHFERVDNLLDPEKQIFQRGRKNYQGKMATLLMHNYSLMPFESTLKKSGKITSTFGEKIIPGLIITTFFSSNLTAMMTKRPELNHIRNFKDLRESNLTVVVDGPIKRFIENKIDSEFFKNIVLNSLVVSTEKKAEMLLSLNNSYAYALGMYFYLAME